MPAQSKQQQKFMGMVHALKKGEMKPSDASPELKKAAQSMSDKDAKDFASTPHKGLPKKVRQEILNKLKEYANKMGTDHLGGDDYTSSKKGGLRDNDGYDNVDYNRDMPQDEGKLPNNWMQGRVSDYHTSLRGKKKDYSGGTNFRKDNSGQPDLEDEIKEAGEDINNAVIPGDVKIKLQRALEILQGKKLTYPQKLQVLGRVLDSLGIDKKELNRVTQKIKTKLETVTEDAPCWDGYKQVGMKNKGGKQVPNCVKESVNEAGLKGTENIPSNKKLSQLSDNEKLNIIQSLGNIISFHIPDWAKGRYKMWQVISAGKIKKKKDLDGEIIYFLPGKGPQKSSPTYKSVKDLINGVDWDTMELRRESVNEASFHALNNPRFKKATSDLVKNKKIKNPETKKDVALTTALNDKDHPAHNQAKSLFQRLKSRLVGEYGQRLDLSYLEDEDARLDGTPAPKDAIDRDLNETMIRRAVDIAQELLPKDTWSRFASDGKKNAEFVKNVVRDLTQSLNRFYKNHNINVRLKEDEGDSNVDMVLGVLSILRQIEDKENRQKVAVDMIKKFKEQNIDFDYKEFLELMKEYNK